MDKLLIGTNVMAARKRANYSQADIAKSIDVSANTVGNWERGTADIPLSKAWDIADMFDTSIDEMVGRK